MGYHQENTMKVCCTCKEELSIESFSKNQRKCKQCVKAYNKANYLKNKAVINDQAKQWYVDNKERAKANHMNWASNNKEKAAAYKRVDKPYCYITTHNEHYYIGVTQRTWTERFSHHKGHDGTKLGQYIKKFGLSKKDFDTQFIEFETREEATAHESKLIRKHIKDSKCLNKAQT